jgi:hypothetical protein
MPEELHLGIEQKYLVSSFEFLGPDPLVVPSLCSVFVHLGTVISIFSPFL